VSNSADSGVLPDQAALKRLERAVTLALKQLGEAREHAQEAAARSSEYETLVRRFTEDEDEPGRMLSRLQILETENQDLRTRVEKSREGVERMLAKIRFLEEQR
jgi:septal ring factor EnvC (AmiA/AmiB activator)